MRLHPNSFVDLETPADKTSTGLMRTHLFLPVCERPVPAVILYSEIYQMTGPIARTAAMLAGQGYLVAVPEVYHEHVELGEVFAYDKEGTDRGNLLKITKELASYDSDSRAVIDYLKVHPQCSGSIGTIGICLGGHLAFRAAMNPEISVGICFYATDIHQGSLGKGKSDNSLARMHEIKAEMMMVWGRQDPHIPQAGRRLIYDAMTEANIHFTWHEFNGEHAFLRDEGRRYDPELSHQIHSLMYRVLERTLK